MGFASILALILQLAGPTVLTIESVVGEAQSGADKKTMAQTALAGATQAALAVLPNGSSNAVFAQAASSLASTAIDAAVSFGKLTGQYQAATKAAASVAAPATATTTSAAAAPAAVK